MAPNYKFTATEIIAQGRTTQENVEEICSWIGHLKEKFVPTVLQAELIVLFLLACNNDIVLTKHTIICYFKLRKASPLIFENRRMDCQEIQLALNTISVSVVSRPIEREIIHFYRLRDTYYKNAKIEYCVKIICMLLDICQEENPPDSITLVVDMTGCSLMHLTMIHFESLKTMFGYIQEACPVRTNTVHFINSNFMLQKLLSLCKSFMKQGTVAKIHCHQGVKGLSNYIPKEYLPEDYNGLQPSLEELRKDIFKKFEARQSFWEKEEIMRKECYMSN